MIGILLKDDNNFADNSSGDMILAETSYQNIRLLITYSKGNYLKYREAGVGVGRFRNAPVRKTKIVQLIERELAKDKLRVRSVKLLPDNRIEVLALV